MENKKTDYVLVGGTFLMVLFSILSAYVLVLRYFFVVSVIMVISYLYVHADTYSYHEKGSSQWRTYRYLTLFGLCCALCMYIYAAFYAEDNSQNSMFLPVLMAVFGNMAPKIAYNRTLGLRLPWTLESEDVWKYAHRMLGYTTIPCVVLMLCSFIFSNNGLYILSLLLWIFIPAVLSYQYSDKKGLFHMKWLVYDLHFMIIGAFVVMLVGSILLYPSLPENLPMQFASDGSVNWYLPKLLGIWIMPLVGVLLVCAGKGKNQKDYRQVLCAWLLTVLDLWFLFYIAYLM